VTVQRASDQAQTTTRTTRRQRPLRDRTCYRCLSVLRTKSETTRVYCERCRSRYGFPKVGQAEPATAGPLLVGGRHGD
jgi:hypothetical protein